MLALNRYTVNLIWELAYADFKLRYRGSFLGFLWSLLNPLFLLGTLYLVFSVFMRFQIPNYSLFLLLGIVLWQFLSESTSEGLDVILVNPSLIKKVYFPREIIILGKVLNKMLITVCNLAVFFLFTLVLGITPTIDILYFLFTMLSAFLVILGAVLALSSLYVFFRDVIHIWQVALQAGFWLTPIVYDVSMAPAKYRIFFEFNPMSRIIMTSREILIYHTTPSLFHMGVTFLMSFVIFIVGYFIFLRLEPRLADVV